MASDFRLKEQLPELTDKIVRTYSEVSTINHLGHCPLPSLRRDRLGLRGSQGDSLSGLSPPRRAAHGQCHLSRRRADRRAARQADAQIGRALRHDAGASEMCNDEHDFEALGQAKAIQFLEQLPELRKELAMDVQAAYDGDPAVRNLDEVIFCYPGLEAVTIYRLAHVLYELRHSVHPADDDRIGPFADRDRHPSRREDRQAFFHRPRHGRGDRRDVRDRRPCEALSGRDARRV